MQEIRAKKIGHIENKGKWQKQVLFTNYLNVSMPKLRRYSKSSVQRNIYSCTSTLVKKKDLISITFYTLTK